MDGDQQGCSNRALAAQTNIQDTLWVPEHGDKHLQGPEGQEMGLEMRTQGIHE